jgi:hypothetical protein
VYRFKAFDSAQCGDVLSTLEARVNAWMEEEHPRIRHMCQSTRGEHILLSFVYEHSYDLEQRVAALAQKSNTGTFSRIFDSDAIDDPPTSPCIPATPPPVH